MSLRKVSPKIFRLAGIRTLPYLCDMGDISSSRSSKIYVIHILAVFILTTHYPSGRTWSNILKFVWLCVFSIKTGTRRIMRPDELPFVVHRSRRISKESSSKRKIRLVPVFMLEAHNQTNYKCLSKFVQRDIASSSIKASIHHFIFNHLFRVSYEPTQWPVGLLAQLPRALHWQKLRI